MPIPDECHAGCGGGYPWTGIPMEHRADHMAALEAARVDQDIVPFARFIARLVKAVLEGKAVATAPRQKPRPTILRR